MTRRATNGQLGAAVRDETEFDCRRRFALYGTEDGCDG